MSETESKQPKKRILLSEWSREQWEAWLMATMELEGDGYCTAGYLPSCYIQGSDKQGETP